MQLQGSERSDPQSGGRGASTGGPRMQQSAPDMSNFYNHTGLYQSRSDTGVRTYTGSQEHSTPNSHKTAQTVKVAMCRTQLQI